MLVFFFIYISTQRTGNFSDNMKIVDLNSDDQKLKLDTEYLSKFLVVRNKTEPQAKIK